MDISTLIDYLSTASSILSLPVTLVTIYAFFRATGRRQKILLIVFVPIAIAAYTIDVLDRFGVIRWSVQDPILGYGMTNRTLFMRVNSAEYLKYKDKFKMMLVVNIPYANVDRMTDTFIEKSAMFTITGDILNIGIPDSMPTQLRAVAPTDIKPGEIFQLLGEFSLVVVPTNSAPEQIKSLSDVEKIGGKILATRGATLNFIKGDRLPEIK